mmetsp:Transcript_3820/g.12322  ORF Transcript_3820/g.12322 Transcript_3820/m.12322 type:complete len:219 (+) Transcript_3820:84-740(+)
MWFVFVTAGVTGHGGSSSCICHLPPLPRAPVSLSAPRRARRDTYVLSRSRRPALAHRAPRPHAHRRAASSHSAAARHDHRAEEQAAWRLRLACLLRLRRLAPLALCSLAAPQGWAYSAAASGKTEAGGGADAAASRAMVSSRALSRSRAGSSSVLPVGCGVASDGVSPARKPRMAGLSCWKSGVLMKISMAMSVPIPAHASRNTTFSTGDCSSSSGSE